MFGVVIEFHFRFRSGVASRGEAVSESEGKQFPGYLLVWF